MLARYQQLLAQARASYSAPKAAEERRHERLAYLVYRPLSFYLTPLFLALRWTADGVTVLQIGLAALMPVAAWAGGLAGAIGIVGIGLGIQVLDCVDGNIARTTRYSSVIGGVLDGWCTQLFWVLYFFAVGVLAQRSGDSWLAAHGREIGLALGALMLAQRGMEDEFDNAFRERVRWTPPAVAHETRFGWVPKVAEHGFAFGGPLVAASVSKADWFLALVAAYQLIVLLAWMPRFGRAVHVRMRQRKE